MKTLNKFSLSRNKALVAYLIVLLLMIIAPLVIKDAFILRLFTTTYIFSIVCFGNMLVVGYTGMLCLGFVAFYGIGSYAGALAAKELGFGFLLSVLFAGIVAAIVGFVISLPCLRLSVDFVGLITTSFLNIFLAIARNWRSLTGGPNGVTGIPRPVIFGYRIASVTSFYYLMLIFMVLSFILLNNIIHSKYGRMLQGIRDNELGAVSVGVDSRKMKIFAFTVGSLFAGIAGSLYSFYISAINPDNFIFNISTQIMQMCVLGGMGSLPGAVIGAAFFTVVPELYRSLALYRIGLGGIIMVLCMLFRPQGLLGSRAFAGDKGFADRIKRARVVAQQKKAAAK